MKGLTVDEGPATELTDLLIIRVDEVRHQVPDRDGGDLYLAAVRRHVVGSVPRVGVRSQGLNVDRVHDWYTQTHRLVTSATYYAVRDTVLISRFTILAV